MAAKARFGKIEGLMVKMVPGKPPGIFEFWSFRFRLAHQVQDVDLRVMAAFFMQPLQDAGGHNPSPAQQDCTAVLAQMMVQMIMGFI
jgi:hypothetical protein